MKILIFLIGFIIGGMAGIVCMCMVQINRHSENELINAKKDFEKNHDNVV